MMYHKPPDNFLYSAYKILTKHSDGTTLLDGMATCFVLEIGKGRPWIITNRHVIDKDYNQDTPKYKNFSLIGMDVIGRLPDDTEYTMSIDPKTSHFYSPNKNNDIAIILPRILAADRRSFHWHFQLDHLANHEMYKSIFPFDTICFSGFPRTHDKLMGRPILRCGTIASDPNFNYSWDKTDRGNIVAYEGFSTDGASGSPIFAPSYGLRNIPIPYSRPGYLIGVNAGHVFTEYGHSGISYFYKSTVIIEIIEKYDLTHF